MLFIVAFICIALSVSFLGIQSFFIMALNQLVVAFLRKQLMDIYVTNSSKFIGLDSGNYTEFKPLGPKLRVDRFRFRQVIYQGIYKKLFGTRTNYRNSQVIGLDRFHCI